VEFDATVLSRYLAERSGAEVHIREIRELGGEATGQTALKQFGYGRPFRVTYSTPDQEEDLVFHRVKRNRFGREREEDRVAAVWLDFRSFNRLPRHVPAMDMVIHVAEGEIRSIRSADEMLLVTRYRPGHLYARDLVRILDEGTIGPVDIERVEALASYLAEVHHVTYDDPLLWRRRLRDLIGHGEGIMGLTESYPEDADYTTSSDLRHIEERANQWRWRLKSSHHRLSQVHGDFHPFNILFETELGELGFYVLDRSRGEWGEPADDVSCLTINYLFFSLQRSEILDGPFQELHDRFWTRYLNLRHDEELMRAIQPWFAWRALVLASPVWYPDIPGDLRRKLLTFARRVLSSREYDYHHINQYLKDSP